MKSRSEKIGVKVKLYQKTETILNKASYFYLKYVNFKLIVCKSYFSNLFSLTTHLHSKN